MSEWSISIGKNFVESNEADSRLCFRIHDSDDHIFIITEEEAEHLIRELTNALQKYRIYKIK
jgi:hypothetical protein